MSITIRAAIEPTHVLWEDLKIGEGAQSVTNPGNILLKTSYSNGLRLQPSHGEEVLTIQSPGCESPWYRCEVEIVFQPIKEPK